MSRRSELKKGKSTIVGLVGQARTELDRVAAGRSGQGVPGHAGRLGQDKRGTSKATYNLPMAVLDLIIEMADYYDIPKNDLIIAAITMLHNAQAANPDLIYNIRAPGRLLNVGYRLDVPADFGIFPPSTQA